MKDMTPHLNSQDATSSHFSNHSCHMTSNALIANKYRPQLIRRIYKILDAYKVAKNLSYIFYCTELEHQHYYAGS
jgi:hypothetical protein